MVHRLSAIGTVLRYGFLILGAAYERVPQDMATGSYLLFKAVSQKMNCSLLPSEGVILTTIQWI